MKLTKKDIITIGFAVGTLAAIGILARRIGAVTSTTDHILMTLQEAEIIQGLTIGK